MPFGSALVAMASAPETQKGVCGDVSHRNSGALKESCVQSECRRVNIALYGYSVWR